MKKKPTGVKTYVSIAIVAIIALFLAHPKWLPFSAAQQQSIIQTERDNLIFTRDARTTASQIITLLLALCIGEIADLVRVFVDRAHQIASHGFLQNGGADDPEDQIGQQYQGCQDKGEPERDPDGD